MKELFRLMWSLVILLRDNRDVTTQSGDCALCTVTVKRLKSNTITIKLVPKS